ncbi:retropepsin-like domain-containing protein [Sphingomonas sp. S1-29]|uniref:aspartyl protease family protein n=1 Tax=Sphingomonas sp. S1-29 TaxID=2991074 RepID=UPI00224053F8|nr:retropepsin-like aspartic protease [Sphingomonas sp. S1-29]UZK68466.1 retropepsin-like domain-containing protein [Sphingomonas sp. S1-29]
MVFGPLPQIELRADRRRLLCDVLVLGPDNPVQFEGFRGRALIDTGATSSGIGPAPIAKLGLRSHGKKTLGSATEEKMVDYYLFRLALQHGGDGDVVPAWPFVFDRIDGFSWRREAQFDVIVGMDILMQCDLHLQRGGACTLRFG